MRSHLIFIELLLLLLPFCGLQAAQTGITAADSTVCKEYNLLMEVRGREITGICAMNIEPGGHIVGTVVNEFGVKAFDFVFADGKAAVMNVIGPLNKWYIRKVLRKDLTFILTNMEKKTVDAVKGKRRLTIAENGTVSMHNDRFGISYTFTSMRANHETDQ